MTAVFGDGIGTAVLRVESRKRLRGSLVLLAVFGLLSAMYLSMFPDIKDDMEGIAELFPEWMFEAFGLDALHTIEGFIAAEVYSFFWAILVAVYFAHLGAGMIAADVRTRKMDLTLSNPVSRESVLVQKVASLWVPLVVLNVGVAVILAVGSTLIDEPIDPVALSMVHLLSVPYLLVCAAIGVVLSVVVDHERTAKAAAIGLVFLLWLVDTVSRLNPDFEWVGALTPSRYFNETRILVHEEYAVLDAGVLLVTFFVLLAAATVLFVRRDI